MENTRKSGIAYLFQLAGKYKLHLALSAVFGIFERIMYLYSLHNGL